MEMTPGQVNYEAVRSGIGSGEAMPPWEDLSETLKEAYRQAAFAVLLFNYPKKRCKL